MAWAFAAFLLILSSDRSLQITRDCDEACGIPSWRKFAVDSGSFGFLRCGIQTFRVSVLRDHHIMMVLSMLRECPAKLGLCP